MREGYLKQDQNEMRTAKRIYWRSCWRIVDAGGRDLVVPWMWTKTEARQTAAACGVKILGVLK